MTSEDLSDEVIDMIVAGASSEEILEKIREYKYFPITVGSHWLKKLSIKTL